MTVSNGGSPRQSMEVAASLPDPILTMFFAGHMIFTETSNTILEKSQRYRAVLLTCRDAIKDGPDIAHKENEDLLKDLSSAHLVWHFMEALFLIDHANSEKHISSYLVEWYSLNYPHVAEEVDKILDTCTSQPPRDDDDGFWNSLLKLAIIGDIERVHDLLTLGTKEESVEDKYPYGVPGTEHHVEAEAPRGLNPIITTVRQLLDRAPRHTISTRADGSWVKWQNTCAVWSTARELEGHEGAERLLNVFAGDTDKIAKVCSSWEEMFIACSFYANFGQVRIGGDFRGGASLIANCCAVATSTFRGPEKIAGGALMEAAIGNIGDALVRIEATLPTSWFAAHLCDLLVRQNVMRDSPASEWGLGDNSMGTREFYMKEFAQGLQQYPGFWRVAVDYYNACPTQGKKLVVELLSNTPFDGPSDPKVEKVLHICTKRKLRRTESSICETVGVNCLEHNNLGGAMSWFARGRVFKRAKAVAIQALIRAEREGANSEAARALECVVLAVNNIGDEKMLEMFAYMRDYCKLQQGLVQIAARRHDRESGQVSGESIRFIQDWGSEIISCGQRLVGGGGLPRRFWLVVVYEIARLLELSPEISSSFSRTIIGEFVNAMQLASGPHRSSDLISGLRRRLAFEGAMVTEEGIGKGGLCGIEEVESALNHCRSVLLYTAAERITAE